MEITTAHCLFEQSGTFKKEFIKLGIPAKDYDILNEFGETDFQIDLFNQIELAYDDKKSIFDSFEPNDILMAFFPCIRFEDQIQMHFRGSANGIMKWAVEKKLEYDLKLHEELHYLYNLITKLAVICLRKNLRLIIENPYSTTHYLIKYRSIAPAFIDYDRSLNGDYFKKPTAFWFINCKPENNLLFDEPIAYNKLKKLYPAIK